MLFLAMLGRALDGISRALTDLAGLALAAMAILINVEILGRYVFGYSTLISDEYSGYLFVWASLLGFGYALRSGQFLRVEAMVRRMGPRMHSVCNAFGAAVGLGVSVVLAGSAWGLVATSWRFGSVSIQPSATPLWIPEVIVPVAMAWLAILYLDLLVRSCRDMVRGRSR